MRTTTVAIAAFLLLSPGIALAQYNSNTNIYYGNSYDNYGAPTYGSSATPNYGTGYGSNSGLPTGYTVTAPGSQVSPLQGGRRLYPSTPTLGDSRGYRLTDPTVCTGLLCN